MTEMTSNEMSSVDGGDWKCFAGGLLVGAGLATGQVEVLAVGLVVAIDHC